MEVAEGVDEKIVQAIIEGARAGKYRAAARLIPRMAEMYEGAAEVFAGKATTLLGDAIRRLGAEDAGPFARGE